MRITANRTTLQKLKIRHQVTIDEVEECFLNQTKEFLEDARVDHLTIPPTRWFISETDRERVLKIVFVEHPGELFQLKTAYEPNSEEEKIYDKYAKII
jgi:hypothetical protein